MEIANHLGMNAQSKTSKRAGLAVTLAGLTANATFGPSAERGTPLQAQLVGWKGPVPGSISYQWHGADGPIAGAVEDSFTPDAPLEPGSAIFCVVAIPGAGSGTSPAAVFRDAPPQLGNSLSDDVFDLETGMQIVASADAFTGENLTFSVSGAGAIIDPVTGDVSIPTDTEVDGAQIIVTAANTGGSASTGFQITVEDIAVEGAVPFGALTPEGAGGLPVNASSITQGDPGGHWEIRGGMLVPSAAGEGRLSGVYPLVFDSGDTLDVMIEDHKASARVDELAAVFADLPVTARGLMVQDGDARPLGRIRLEPKIFDQEMVIEPTNWLEDSDPRQSLRPVILGGLTIGGDPSGDAVLRMENLTVQGFECQLETGDGEVEFIGIILVERPSRHIIIRQNEIWSRDIGEIIAADDFRDNVKTSRQMRGISTQVYEGTNDHIRIEDNYLHDVSRGAVLTTTNSFEGVRSRFCGNIIEDCYTNFFTAGFLDGLDIFDNWCMGVYATNADTLGEIPKTSPHSAVGGSFDAGDTRTTSNITMMGNFLHIGWRRTKLHEEMGLEKPGVGATGVKFNDPRAADSYWNLIVAFNTVISHGICMEMSGAGADAHIEVFNNTLAFESYAGSGSKPVFYFSGAQNVRLFNNIGTGYVVGNQDGTKFYATTLETLEGYGNVYLGIDAEGFGEENYFVGNATKGLLRLTIDEALAAYVPKPTTRAMLAEQKKGALGTGLYQGDGVHSAFWNKPAPTGGTAHLYAMTQFDGQYMQTPGGAAMPFTGVTAKGLTFAFKGETAPSVDGILTQIFAMSGQRVYIRKSNEGTIEIKIEDDNVTFLRGSASEMSINSEAGVFNYVVTADFDTGTMLFAINGRLANWYKMNTFDRADLSLNIRSPRIFANEYSAAGDRWFGNMGVVYLADSFVDLETEAGLNSFFAADGNFRDFGTDGSAPTGQQPLIYLKQENGVVQNYGKGGVFTVVG